MEQILTFPFPKSSRPLCAEIIENDPEKRAELLFWQNTLDQVAAGKLSWDRLLQSMGSPLSSHPAARIATTRKGETLLHLAVLGDQNSLVKELSKENALKHRKNSFGLTPLETAQFLNKKESASLLDISSKKDFCSQPNVFVPSSIRELFSDLEYLSHPIFDPSESLHTILMKTKKAKLQDEIPPEKIWMGVYFDKEV